MKTESEKKKALQSALYYLGTEQEFYGVLLQTLNIRYTNDVPTAGIGFNKKEEKFEVALNPDFFCELSLEHRMAILHHEILHFTNKHMFRLPLTNASDEDKILYNIAGDMAINQFIKHLPKGVVDVKEWKLDNGQPFPLLKPMEEYYQLIKSQKKNNKDVMKGYKPYDVHNFYDQLSEEEKTKMLEEAKKVIKRTLEKTSFSGDKGSEAIKDLLEELEGLIRGIDYKNILRKAIKKTVTTTDRKNTWNRPNKRFYNLAPGTKCGELPKCEFFIDTSGSISHKELNEFLNVMGGFLKAGSRTCKLSLWHTSIYYNKKYKLNTSFNGKDIQAGGTDVTDVLKYIHKNKPNLSIILTDGYYSHVDIKLNQEIIWIISKGGCENHPNKNIGKTILLDKLI